MLTLVTDTLPQNLLSYLAFRLASYETFKLLEYSHVTGQGFREPFGFLTEVPFLRDTAPQVQLSLLAQTWSRHISTQAYQASLLDEAVVYAVCETAARIVEHVPELVRSFTEQGPLEVLVPADAYLASELRALHLQLSSEGDFLLVSQFQDLSPEDAQEWKREFRLSDEYLAPMFEVLGQWHADPEITRRLAGLFSEPELQDLVPVLKYGTPAID